MREAGSVVRKSYFDALNGTVILNGVAVPVYDEFVPDSLVTSGNFQYILLSTFTSTPNDTKSNFGIIGVQVVDIVTGFSSGGGKLLSEQISDIVLGIIVPHSTADYQSLAPNFQNVSIQLAGSTTMKENNKTHNVFRKVLRIKHIIQQLQ